jgi:hypothetical protein
LFNVSKVKGRDYIFIKRKRRKLLFYFPLIVFMSINGKASLHVAL